MTTLQSQLFTASGTFTVPDNVTLVFVTMVGGGGSGGGPLLSPVSSNGTGGGGSGEFVRWLPVNVTPADSITVTIGAGGASVTTFASGNNGGDSAFGQYVVDGGYGGVRQDNVNLGAGDTQGRGGGWTGAARAPANVDGVMGTMAGREYTGGSSGGGISTASGNANGGPCEGFLGGTFGTQLLGRRPGSGGAASCFGPGGRGGDGGVANNAGSAPPAGSYGAGGGGQGVQVGFTAQGSGAGLDGACLVQWIGD